MPFGAPFPGGGQVTGQFTDSSGGTLSFTASFGTAATNRSIVAIVTGSSASAISGVTIAGISATSVIANSDSTNRVSMWIAAVPTGATGNISFGGILAANAGCMVYAIYGNRAQAADATAVTNSNGGAMTMAASSAAFVIAAGMSNINANSCTWSGGVTRDTQQNPVSGNFMSAASEATIAAGNVSPAGTFGSPNNPTFAAAVWGP